jgi:hypothetical protein
MSTLTYSVMSTLKYYAMSTLKYPVDMSTITVSIIIIIMLC